MLTLDAVEGWNPEKIFFLDWSWKVPQEITEFTECIGFHPTDLPYGRGGSPYQNLILRRRYVSVLSAFRLTREIDAGPIYLKRPIYLFGSAEEFFERCSFTAFEMIKEILDKQIVPVPQQGRGSRARYSAGCRLRKARAGAQPVRSSSRQPRRSRPA